MVAGSTSGPATVEVSEKREEPVSAPLTPVELLQRQAERYRDKVAFTFSHNGEGADASQLTYCDLDVKTRPIAGESAWAAGPTSARADVFPDDTPADCQVFAVS